MTSKKNRKNDDATQTEKDHEKAKHDWGIHPRPLAVPPANAINPQDLGPAEKLVMDEEDVEAFFDHFHEHPQKPDIDSDSPAP